MFILIFAHLCSHVLLSTFRAEYHNRVVCNITEHRECFLPRIHLGELVNICESVMFNWMHMKCKIDVDLCAPCEILSSETHSDSICSSCISLRGRNNRDISSEIQYLFLMDWLFFMFVEVCGVEYSRRSWHHLVNSVWRTCVMWKCVCVCSLAPHTSSHLSC